MNLTLKDIEDIQRQIDELREQLEAKDKFKDLKKAYSKGAIIECNLKGEDDWLIKIPSWLNNYNYRIKGGISIASWNKHKDIIKQYWKGAKVEYKQNFTTVWIGGEPAWSINSEYRIKPKEPIYEWQLPEYKDGSEWIAAGFDEVVVRDSNKYYTTSGRRRATKALAERCAKASKTRDLLEAYRDHLEPDYIDPDWNNPNIDKYYIYIYAGKYVVDYNFCSRDLGKVYGSQKTMTKICNALNTGEITL